MKIVKDKELRKFVDKNLYDDQSPEAISDRLRYIEKDLPYVSKNSIRRYIKSVYGRRKVNINNVHRSFIRIKQKFPEIKTITLDNDILFQKHKELKRILNVKIYFCHPYHSWEKGLVENINKHIRKYIPKGSDISRYSKPYIKSIEDKLNRRFLNCLNSFTPYEIIESYRKQKNAD